MKVKNILIICLLLMGSLGLRAQQTFTVSNTEELFGAIEKARSLPGKDTVRIVLKGGTYFLNRPITFTEADIHPMIIEGEAGSRPIISGGKALSGWKKSGNGWWQMTVDEVANSGFTFSQLYVNGRRATLARTPNEGFFTVRKCQDDIIKQGPTVLADCALQRITTAPDNLQSLSELSQEELQGIRAVFYLKWDNLIKPLATASPESGEMVFVGQGQASWNHLDSLSIFYLENFRTALDAPGEWFLAQDGLLTYIPRPGEDINKAETIVPVLKRLVVIRGTKERPVTDKKFRNITFSHSIEGDSDVPTPTGQAAVGVGAAIEIDFAERISIDDCEVSHTAGYAIAMNKECYRNRVEHTLMTDLGAGGVKLGLADRFVKTDYYSADNVVDNCIISHAGKVYPCAVGILVLQSGGNKITHNDIFDIRYSGISVGWVWGYTKSLAHDNDIGYNRIHHIGWHELSDMGGIYTLGIQPGTRVHHNIIHDVNGRTYGGWGLYTDEGSTDIVMDCNLVYNTTNGGYHLHYGKDVVITNNIFAFSDTYQIYLTKMEAHRSLDFSHNIILTRDEDMLRIVQDGIRTHRDWNCYWSLTGRKDAFLGGGFGDYKRRYEPHSVLMNPGFRDAEQYDFSFSSLKAARKIGFKPFDVSTAGVYGSSEWKAKAVIDSETLSAWERMERRAEGK